MTLRNIKQDLANYSQATVYDIGLDKLSKKYGPEVARRKAQDLANENEISLNIPHIERVKRAIAEELENIATEEYAHVPVTSVFEALQVVKASKDIDHDIGVRALKAMLENQWKRNRSASISASQYTTLIDHFKRNYPKSAVVSVLQNIGELGYATLEMTKLADIASNIRNQEDYDREILANCLQGNNPSSIKARKFILALVNEETERSFEVTAQEDSDDADYDRLTELKKIWEERGSISDDEYESNLRKELREKFLKNDRKPLKGRKAQEEPAEEEFDSHWGKFESPLAKKLWDFSMDSDQDDSVGDASSGPGWAALFKPEKAILYVDTQGFVTADEFDDEESLMKHWEYVSKELDFNEFDDEEDEENSDNF